MDTVAGGYSRCSPGRTYTKGAQVSWEAARRSLLSLADQNRPYEFLHKALSYLARVPDDLQIRLLVVRSYAEVGLFGPALELVDERPELIEQVPELASTVQALRGQDPGHVPWAAQSDLFERNLAVVCDRFETCRGHREDLRSACEDLELFRSRDGNLLLRRRKESGPAEWLPGMVDWLQIAKSCEQLQIEPQGLCPPLLVEGVGLGHTLRQLYKQTSKMLLTYTPRIHVFEANLAQLAAWLHVADDPDMLGDERFQLWVGPDREEAFLDFHRRDLGQIIPVNVIRQPGWGPSAEATARVTLERLTQETKTRDHGLRATIWSELADRSTPDHYARRFGERHERPLRLLGITSRFTSFLQYSMRDIEQAARSLGHEFRYLMEEHDHTPCLRREYINKHVREFLPDLIILLDHNRKEYGETYDYPIPYCNWIQDDLGHLFRPDAGKNVDPYDLVVGLIGQNRLRAAGYRQEQCSFMPMPVNVHKFSNAPVSEADRQTYACEISFVSHLNQTREELLRLALQKVGTSPVARLLKAQYEQLGSEVAQGRIPGTPMQTVDRIQALARELGLEIDKANANQIRQLFTDRLINAFFREQVLEWASRMDLNLHIYGKGWERHPTLARHARGPAEHGHHLRCIYQASKMNLQAVSTGVIHQRLIEGLCCGGFFVIRRTPSDDVAALQESIRDRCIALGLQTDAELWDTNDEALRQDVRALNEALYAPAQLYEGFVQDQYFDAEHGFRMQAGSLLPHYQDVGFRTQEEFEQVVSRYLNDEGARAEVVHAQRHVAVSQFSYEYVLERILDYAHQRFSALAAEAPSPAAGISGTLTLTA